MKRSLWMLLITCLLMAFRPQADIGEMIAALKVGNAAQIARLFDNTVEITLPEKSSTYSKNQAEVVLRDFFNLHPVKNFEVLHQGENGGAQYCIGTLHTKTGIYRTTVYMKRKAEKQIVQEIRFELN
jgi:Domain of unknown function (DUF4783)